MSVFIQIKQAELSQSTIAHQISLQIQSKDTELGIQPIPTNNIPLLTCSLIASIKQKQLTFIVTLLDINQQQSKNISTQLSFSPLYCSPEKQTSETMTFGQDVKIHYDIFYTKKQHYLGPIEFYQFDNVVTSSIMLPAPAQKGNIMPTEVQEQTLLMGGKQTQSELKYVDIQTSEPEFQSQKVEKQTLVQSKGFFFCCGNQNNQAKYEVEDYDGPPPPQIYSNKSEKDEGENEGKKVQFYKGACQSKNLFSCCDAGVNDNKFTVVEDYYRD